MRALKLFLLVLFIFFLILGKNTARAQESLDFVQWDIPSEFYVNEPFILNFHLNELLPDTEYKYKIYAKNLSNENIPVENWDRNGQKWLKTQSNSSYQLKSNYPSNMVVLKVPETNEISIDIKFGISILKNGVWQSAQTYSKRIILSTNPVIFNTIVNIPPDLIQNSYWQIKSGNSISNGISTINPDSGENSIKVPAGLENSEILWFDAQNKLIGKVNNLSWQEYSFDCKPVLPKVEGIEYTVKNIDIPQCQDEIENLFFDSGGNLVGDNFVFPSKNETKNLFLRKRFFNHYVQFFPLVTQSNALNINLINEISLVGDEWIEIYNSLDETISLCNWKIDDGDGGSTPFTIESNCTVKPKYYHIIEITKHLLNDAGDNFVLLNSNNIPIYSLKIDKMVKNQSMIWWNNLWQITDTITRGQDNIYYRIPVATKTTQINLTSSEIDPTVYQIKINQISQFNNKRVKIIGKIVNPQGSSWYLEDETGSVRIYLQTKYHIKHPRYKKGMILSVIGIANWYKTYWRILPQSAQDLVIIQDPTIKKTVKTKPKANSPPKIVLTASTNAQSLPHYNQIDSVVEVKGVQSKTSNPLQVYFYIVIINCLLLIGLWYGKIKQLYFRRE